MRKGLNIRAIGGASEKAKKEIKHDIERALFDHFDSLSQKEQEMFIQFERPKSEKELAVIQLADKETSQLMQEAGVEPYSVPFENFHIVSPDIYKKLFDADTVAASFCVKQGIIFNDERFRNNPVYLGISAFHELLHLKGHLSIEVEEEESASKIHGSLYRHGVTAYSSQQTINKNQFHFHFSGLHEAIVSEAEKQFLPKLLDLPELALEKRWLNSETAKNLKKKIAIEKGIPEEDIIWVNEDGSDYEDFSYRAQRKVLKYVCEEIKKQYPEQFKDSSEVYKLFLKVHFTGQLLPIARLMEKTFGEGSFRLLGNMETSNESGILHLESLQKARARYLRESLKEK